MSSNGSKRARLEYLILWKERLDPSWEVASEAQCTLGAVADYWASKGLTPPGKKHRVS
jgi:hypothetical protein